jgi:hypothetical protein
MRICRHIDVTMRLAQCARCGQHFLYCPICAEKRSLCPDCSKKKSLRPKKKEIA